MNEVCLLFLGDAVAAHALARVVNLGHDILRDGVASAYDAEADGNWRPVAMHPAPG